MGYPRTAPHDAGLLTMSDGQRLAWEVSGAPDGIPVLFLHGGPGGTRGRRGYVTRYDPERYRIISCDQRGCGESVPLAGTPEHDLAANTTERLVADLEALREHLGVERWLVSGASWGSTLAIAYAQAHRDRVLAMILVAVTSTSRREVDWITETVGAIFPEEWEEFAMHAERGVPEFVRGTDRLVEAYRRLMASPDLSVRDRASRAWARWEDAHVSLLAGEVLPDPRWGDDAFRTAFVTLTTHYWANDGFADPPLLEGMRSIQHIPAVLIHGRADVSGPAITPWLLHRRWPASTLQIVEDGGHGGAELADLWLAAADDFADRLGG